MFRLKVESSNTGGLGRCLCIIPFDSHSGALRDAVNSVLPHEESEAQGNLSLISQTHSSTWMNVHRDTSLESTVKSSAKKRLREK